MSPGVLMMAGAAMLAKKPRKIARREVSLIPALPLSVVPIGLVGWGQVVRSRPLVGISSSNLLIRLAGCGALGPDRFAALGGHERTRWGQRPGVEPW